ncbi:hypothetical protein [Marinomonas algicola]|uniref:hypothetical protein n=1 Tax=Marinomonas algicola TaxID=2773454 RepID=UPI00174D8CFC|nr:hypothetical protein [Marinomonas algicola]
MGLPSKKLIIHIGMPKTGSSAIQALFALNEAYFKSKGIVFPWYDGFTQSYQTSGGNAELLLKWMSSQDRRAFDQAISALNETTVVISSESLFYTFKQDPQGFFEFFTGYDFLVICYARDLVQLVDSSLNQAVKNHGFLVNDENLAHIIEDCYYLDVLSHAAQFVESGNLSVRWYDKTQFGGEGIYADFLQLIGVTVDLSQLTRPNKVVNPSLSPDAFAFRALLNSFSALPTSDGFKYQINALLAQYSVEYSSSGLVLNEERIHKIQQSYGVAFERFWKTFWTTEPPAIGQHAIRSTSNGMGDADQALCTMAIKKILTFLWQQNPQVLLLILESFLKSEWALIDNASKVQRVVRNALAIEWLRSLSVGKLTDLELQLCGLLRVFLTPTLTLDGNTYPFSVKDWSEDIGSRSSLGGGLVVESIGNDPFFELIAMDGNSSNTACWVWLSIQVPVSGCVQLYYTTTQYPIFSPEKMLNIDVLEGEQSLSFVIDDPEFTGRIRLDPGSDACIYLIRQLSLYSVYYE